MTTRFKFLVMAGLCLSLTLAGCGRKAPLEIPGGSTPSTEGAVDPATSETVARTVANTPTQRKSFFLDPLIGLK